MRTSPASPTAASCWPLADDGGQPLLCPRTGQSHVGALFGRGLVEPLDDMRATNPATNEPLLDDLAKHFRGEIRSQGPDPHDAQFAPVSTRGQSPTSTVIDEQNFSHATSRAMPAEVLLDAISQATGVAEKFNGWPLGYRAIQVWDNRMPSYFFGIFGRPARNTVCECERSNEPSIAQALHLMNSEEIAAKIHDREGTARRLARSKKTPPEIIDEFVPRHAVAFPQREGTRLDAPLFHRSGRGSPGSGGRCAVGFAQQPQFCVQSLRMGCKEFLLG